jgi:hypothetical protein
VCFCRNYREAFLIQLFVASAVAEIARVVIVSCVSPHMLCVERCCVEREGSDECRTNVIIVEKQHL